MPFRCIGALSPCQISVIHMWKEWKLGFRVLLKGSMPFQLTVVANVALEGWREKTQKRDILPCVKGNDRQLATTVKNGIDRLRNGNLRQRNWKQKNGSRTLIRLKLTDLNKFPNGIKASFFIEVLICPLVCLLNRFNSASWLRKPLLWNENNFSSLVAVFF